jgi:hypothetical protein
MMNVQRIAALAVGLGLWAMPAVAQQDPQTFHLMQIEQVVGGVGGNTAAQAVQLRMRSLGENFVAGGRLVAYDVNGANPVVLLNVAQNVANGLQGDRVLLATTAIKTLTNPPLVADFMMAAPIPPAYLSAGRITWESDAGTIYWSLGNGGYAGSNAGSIFNDNDGDYGPPFAGPFPTTSAQGLLFQGAAPDLSKTNAADYALTGGGAVLTNNARNSFTVTTLPAAPSGLVAVEFPKGVSKLTWADNSNDETGFRIRRQKFVGNLWTNTMFVSTEPANTTLYMETPGVGAWRYQVQALNGAVQSVFTPYIRIKPARPTGMTAQKSNGSAQLGWTDGSDFESRVEVQRSTFAGVWGAPVTIATLGTDAVSYLDSPAPGKYRYRVRSGNTAGTSLWTSWATITLP